MKSNRDSVLRAAKLAPLMALAVLPFLSVRAAAAPATCESLAQFKIDRGEITAAQSVPAGPFTVGGAINQIDPDLSRFKKHGGKLLQYHGWNDPAISPLNSIDYFESVQKKMGDTSDFYRLFMIPGMEHYTGGPGASDFDHMDVIVQWAENGEAPERIVARRGERTHPLCAYPKVAKYNGKGSTDDAASYACAAE